jgi:hypothetical protein
MLIINLTFYLLWVLAVYKWKIISSLLLVTWVRWYIWQVVTFHWQQRILFLLVALSAVYRFVVYLSILQYVVDYMFIWIRATSLLVELWLKLFPLVLWECESKMGCFSTLDVLPAIFDRRLTLKEIILGNIS